MKHIKNALLLGLAGDGLLPAPLSRRPRGSRCGGGGPGLPGCVRAFAPAARRRPLRGSQRGRDRRGRASGCRPWSGSSGSWRARSACRSRSTLVARGARRRVPGEHAGCGLLLLNSASAERPEALDLAAERRADLSCPRPAGSRPWTAGRLDSANAISAGARDRGLRARNCHVDLLVLPAGVDAEAGNAFLGRLGASAPSTAPRST